jgi:hypothetical protein
LAIKAKRFDNLDQETNIATTDFASAVSSSVMNSPLNGGGPITPTDMDSLSNFIANNNVPDLAGLNNLSTVGDLTDASSVSNAVPTLTDLISKSPSISSVISDSNFSTGIAGLENNLSSIVGQITDGSAISKVQTTLANSISSFGLGDITKVPGLSNLPQGIINSYSQSSNALNIAGALKNVPGIGSLTSNIGGGLPSITSRLTKDSSLSTILPAVLNAVDVNKITNILMPTGGNVANTVKLLAGALKNGALTNMIPANNTATVLINSVSTRINNTSGNAGSLISSIGSLTGGSYSPNISNPYLLSQTTTNLQSQASKLGLPSIFSYVSKIFPNSSAMITAGKNILSSAIHIGDFNTILDVGKSELGAILNNSMPSVVSGIGSSFKLPVGLPSSNLSGSFTDFTNQMSSMSSTWNTYSGMSSVSALPSNNEDLNSIFASASLSTPVTIPDFSVDPKFDTNISDSQLMYCALVTKGGMPTSNVSDTLLASLPNVPLLPDNSISSTSYVQPEVYSTNYDIGLGINTNPSYDFSTSPSIYA